jgi:peptidoglycan/LPS O-acetylase OafA/YrhL
MRRAPTPPPRPLALRLLVGLLLFQGLSGLGGGIGLMMDPSGQALGLSMTLLEGSPFPDYLVPGLILFIVLGMAPMVAARVVWEGRPGSWMAALAVGAALMVWIAMQLLIVGYHASPPLQALYGSLGLIILVLSLLGSVRGFPRLLGRAGE